MNLEQSIKWLRGEIEKLEKENAPQKQIDTYKKCLAWIEELFRWRLMYSETHREIHLNEQNNFSKKWVLDLLDEQVKEWKLKPWEESFK